MNVQRKRISCWIAVAVIASTATAAIAALQLIDTSTKTKGATTVTWESSWADFNYTLGNTVNITVNWTVDTGVATYSGFEFKRCTPRGMDPATGSMGTVTYPGSNGANSVDVDFTFDGLHLDRQRNVEIGNAHFKLELNVDKDGDGNVDSRMGCGVNLHVEDPQ